MGFGKALVSSYKKAKREADRKAKAAERLAAKTPRRFALEPVADGLCMPLGVRGLTPVSTVYQGGKDVVCYAFTNDTVDALISCVEEVNKLLDDASTLSGHEFGAIDSVNGCVPALGWGFCRVEYTPRTKSGSECKTPVKVYIETSEETCSPGSYSGLVKYDTSGLIKQVEITEWVSPHFTYKMKATRARGELAVRSVSQSGLEEPLYKA